MRIRWFYQAPKECFRESRIKKQDYFCLDSWFLTLDSHNKMIGIIRYGAGNIFSLTAALERLGIEYGMVFGEADFEQFDRFIIPGVGHAGAAMSKLEQSGMVARIKSLQKP